MKRSAIVTLFVLFNIATPVFSADEANAISCPSLQVGDRYTQVRKSPAETQEGFAISAVSANTMEATTDNGLTVVFDKSFNLIRGSDGRSYSPKYYLVPDCPFKLGDSKSYPAASFSGSTGGMNNGRSTAITVDDRFGVTRVPAGEFKTVKVVSVFNYNWERTGRSGSARTTHTSYVTPEGLIVKMESVDINFSSSGNVQNTWVHEMTSLPAKTSEAPPKTPIEK